MDAYNTWVKDQTEANHTKAVDTINAALKNPKLTDEEKARLEDILKVLGSGSVAGGKVAIAQELYNAYEAFIAAKAADDADTTSATVAALNAATDRLLKAAADYKNDHAAIDAAVVGTDTALDLNYVKTELAKPGDEGYKALDKVYKQTSTVGDGTVKDFVDAADNDTDVDDYAGIANAAAKRALFTDNGEAYYRAMADSTKKAALDEALKRFNKVYTDEVKDLLDKANALGNAYLAWNAKQDAANTKALKAAYDKLSAEQVDLILEDNTLTNAVAGINQVKSTTPAEPNITVTAKDGVELTESEEAGIDYVATVAAIPADANAAKALLNIKGSSLTYDFTSPTLTITDAGIDYSGAAQVVKVKFVQKPWEADEEFMNQSPEAVEDILNQLITALPGTWGVYDGIEEHLSYLDISVGKPMSVNGKLHIPVTVSGKVGPVYSGDYNETIPAYSNGKGTINKAAEDGIDGFTNNTNTYFAFFPIAFAGHDNPGRDQLGILIVGKDSETRTWEYDGVIYDIEYKNITGWPTAELSNDIFS